MPEIQFVPLVDVAPEHQHLVTPDLLVANQNCKTCYGRGYSNWTRTRYCSCLLVNCTAFADRMTRAREAWLKEHPEDLMTIGITGPQDQPKLEADNGNA